MNAMSPPPPDDNDRDDDNDHQWTFLLAMVGVIAIVVIGFLLVWKMWQNEKLQECLLSGRRDCAPIDIPASR
jgi:hypothetical protein